MVGAEMSAVVVQTDWQRLAAVEYDVLFHMQVIELVGLAAGFLEGVPLEAVPSRLEFMAAHVQQRQPALLREITRTRRLTDEQREVNSRQVTSAVKHQAYEWFPNLVL